MENTPNNSQASLERYAQTALSEGEVLQLRAAQKDTYNSIYSEHSGEDPHTVEALVAEAMENKIEEFLGDHHVMDGAPEYSTYAKILRNFSYDNMSDTTWQYGEWQDSERTKLGPTGADMLRAKQTELFGNTVGTTVDAPTRANRRMPLLTITEMQEQEARRQAELEATNTFERTPDSLFDTIGQLRQKETDKLDKLRAKAGNDISNLTFVATFQQGIDAQIDEHLKSVGISHLSSDYAQIKELAREFSIDNIPQVEWDIHKTRADGTTEPSGSDRLRERLANLLRPTDDTPESTPADTDTTAQQNTNEPNHEQLEGKGGQLDNSSADDAADTEPSKRRWKDLYYKGVARLHAYFLGRGAAEQQKLDGMDDEEKRNYLSRKGLKYVLGSLGAVAGVGFATWMISKGHDSGLFGGDNIAALPSNPRSSIGESAINPSDFSNGNFGYSHQENSILSSAEPVISKVSPETVASHLTPEQVADFNIPDGGGGEALMNRLNIDSSKWYDIQDELLDKFPDDFYRMSDGNVGIGNPGKQSDEIVKFISQKTGIWH